MYWVILSTKENGKFLLLESFIEAFTFYLLRHYTFMFLIQEWALAYRKSINVFYKQSDF